MKVLEEVTSDSGILSVVGRDNMLALRNGDVGYSCIYTDNSIYQPIYLSIQKLIETFYKTHAFNKALILGGGCCAIPRFIIKSFNNTVKIDSVEYDPIIVSLTKKYFLNGIPTNNLNIITDDAFAYLQRSDSLYDFVFVDLFVGNSIPDEVHSQDFKRNLIRNVGENSIIAFNAYNKSLNTCKAMCYNGEEIFEHYIIMQDEYGDYSIAFFNGELANFSVLNIVESK